MNAAEARALRDGAAVKTIERLRADSERATHRVRPLVDYVAEHLFEPGLDYERIRSALRIRDNNRTTLFRQEIGLTPAAYVRDCRMEVACRLLRDTSMEVAWIAEIVGYGGPQVFTPAFKRYAEATPTWYRRHHRSTASGPAPAGSVPEDNPTTWRRFVAGELSEGEAKGVLRHLLGTYADLRAELLAELVARLGRVEAEALGLEPAAEDAESPLPALRSLLSREDVEWLMAAAVWDEIAALPTAERLAAVRRPLRFATPAFLRFLGARIRLELEAEPRAAVETAQLALEHACEFDRAGGERGIGPWRAVAWLWLGVAKWRADDPAGAATARSAAERFLPAALRDAAPKLVKRLLAEAIAALETEPPAPAPAGSAHSASSGSLG